MPFVPRLSTTEKMVDPETAYMEFNLQTDMGYGEWLAYFMQREVAARRFNGYMMQTDVNVAKVSTTPVEIHLFTRGIFVSSPGETQEYFYELPRSSLFLARAYFLAHNSANSNVHGYHPHTDELSALDLWVQQEDGQQLIYTFFYEAHLKTAHGEYQIERYTL